MSSLGTVCIHPADYAMSSSTRSKTEMGASDFEVESHDLTPQPKLKTLDLVDGARTALTALGLLAAASALGVSASSLAVYRETHLPAEFRLPLWPENLDARPTVALVVCSAIAVIANGASLVLCRAKSIQSKASYPIGSLLLPPIVSLVAALVAISFFYAVNTSVSVDTIQSWSCQWRRVAMTSSPNFGSVCQQSQAALNLSTVLVPLQAIVVGAAAWQVGLGKVVNRAGVQERRSPTPSGKI
ncbi:uncharacterized protein DNG_03799 [Cephalotrichum gorgonifer]|uniref:Uncharacterized protein n=1 Tax=Cephalotrichum gorgonifer TaxID=2041049 RepID=A0AAE8SUL7_9PEZI|nr:uncharacterized protein DNG_03799 [Cephalotrichum gorgonifer]